jgi:hypothetical protein
MSKKELDELTGIEQPIKKPISTKARKAKGRSLQNKVAEAVRNLTGLPKTDVKSNPMGNSGIDVLLSQEARQKFPYAVECKNQEKLNIWETLKQAEGNAKNEDLKPLVVFKRSNTKPYVVMGFDDFFELLNKLLDKDL